MSSRNLEYLLAPHSVALVGASDRPDSVGARVMRNLLAGGFDGPIWPVNLRRAKVAGVAAFPHVADLPSVPDLAIVCTPAPTVPALISQLGAIGTRAAIVMTAGLEAPPTAEGTLAQAMLDAARPYTLRILGPDSAGLLLPRIGLNASFAPIQALPGNLAFIAQSDALDTKLLDWARTAQVGFSCIVSLGKCADVDFGDLLDSLCHDPHTRTILLCVESITGARKFMSAARAAARNKPVIVALANTNDVYDAAFRRAGMLRVETTRELFDAAETLTRLRPVAGERLAVISDGDDPVIMAADALHAVRYRRNQRQLMEVPSSIPDSFVPRPEVVKTIVTAALADGRSILTGTEAKDVLSAYSIPVAETQAAADDASARRPFAQQLIAAIKVDPTFGPVIVFGKGEVEGEVAPDRAIGFPPLNTVLAAELISRTRVRRLLRGSGNVSPTGLRALEHTLVQLSQLAVDIAEIAELDINPLLADEQGVIALDARIRVARASARAADRLAIRPYPKELEETVAFDGRQVLLRPLRPEDAPQHREFLTHISEEDMHSRFFRAVKELPAADLAYLTQIDYERAMAFIAVATGDSGRPETLGVVRAQADADNESAEFAVLVRSDLKGQGLGSVLMEKIIRYCRQRGIHWLKGDVLATNSRMLQLASVHGFRSETVREGAVRVALDLSLAE
jgi:acyl-CoA synthetase (NDP forming)/GNAT superfamily N-acetyltransferase